MTRSRWPIVGTVGLLAVGAVWLTWREPDYARVSVGSLPDAERELESLRARSRIPGMSAAIAEGDRVIWARGFGIANTERGIQAGPDTIYPLASLTKPYGSTVILQLVQDDLVRLDDPASKYGIEMKRSAPVTIRHLLSHTSGEPPGTSYRYDGNAFGALTRVVEGITGQSFAKNLEDRIIRPLGLAHTRPSTGDPREFAQGYARAWGRSIWPTGLFGPMRALPHGFELSTTAGLLASAPDVARFSIALDQGRLLNDSTKALAWTPALAQDGKPLPYALGWFVQDIQEHQVIWHYGHAYESSSLIVKLPVERVTFVILANSDGLSRWRQLGDSADVMRSPAATLFMNWHLANEVRR